MTDRVIAGAFCKDGHTWGDWRLRDLPETGEFDTPQPKWLRCGSSRQHVFKHRVTSAVNVTILACSVLADNE